MGVKVTDRGDLVEVQVDGRFTFESHKEFRPVIDNLDHGKAKKVEINLSRATFVDSAGLGMLLLLRDAAEKYRVSLVLDSPSDALKPTFRVARFYDLFTIR